MSRAAVASQIQPRSSDAMPDAHLRNLRDLKERKSVTPARDNQTSRHGEVTPKRGHGAGLNLPQATEGNSSIMQSEARKNLSTR